VIKIGASSLKLLTEAVISCPERFLSGSETFIKIRAGTDEQASVKYH
jgi:hypothetical protein